VDVKSHLGGLVGRALAPSGPSII